MKTIDLAKTCKDLYTATGKVKEVVAAAGTFLVVDGQGAPGGEAFQQAMMALYATTFTLKFALKQAGTLDFKVGKPECVYFSDPQKTPVRLWKWRILLRIPDAVTAANLTAAKKALMARKVVDVSAVKRLRWKEGRAVQVLHVGPYDQVCRTFNLLLAHIEQARLAIAGPAHEIYLSDPRKTAAAKLKTIVRLPVKPLKPSRKHG